MSHIQLIGISEPKSQDGKIWKFPFAFPIIVASLEQTSHTFSVVDTHLDKLTTGELFEFVSKCDALIYGISAWSHNYLLFKELVRIIKEKNKNAIVVVGGVLSENYKVLLETTSVDIVSIGAEGEKILPQILDCCDKGALDIDCLSEINGIVFWKNGEIFKTDKHKVMSKQEYQSSVMPAYHYFDSQLKELAQNINEAKNDHPVKGFPLLTMRGCPFPCTFCAHQYGRRFLRPKWEKFFDEVEFLIENYGAKGFFSFDTNMFLHEGEVDEFCNEYKLRGHTFLACYQLRPTFGNREMFRKLYECGARVILFGLESGSQRMLDNMKKGYKLPEMKRIITDAVKEGMVVHGNFLFGTPGENKKSVLETKDLMIFLKRLFMEQSKEFSSQGKRSTSGYGRSFLIPTPSSELYDICISNGLISSEENYLVYISDEEGKKFIGDSTFKINLAEMGINMSNFPTMQSLKAYVGYVYSLVDLEVYLFDNGKLSAKYFYLLCKSGLLYLKYLQVALIDRLKGNEGLNIDRINKSNKTEVVK